jgi:uncharacterized membrane protein
VRPLEALLLGALLLTVVLWSAQRPRVANALRWSACVALLIAVAQAWLEGPRWQVWPADALAALLFALAMHKPAALGGQLAWRKGLVQIEAAREWVRFRTDHPRAGI